MPFYDFECKYCLACHSALLKFDDIDQYIKNVACASCSGGELERVMLQAPAAINLQEAGCPGAKIKEQRIRDKQCEQHRK